MLISSWEEAVARYPELRESADRPEVNALRDYLRSGGIVKTDDSSKRLKILYPTKKMVDDRIEKLRRQRTYFLKELNRLKSLESELSPIRLAFDPLYIQHQMRMLTDRRYREAFTRLGFTWQHFLDPRTRKIIEQFMKDEDYRARVLQALDESPIYQKRPFGAISSAAKSTRREVINKKVSRIQKKIEELEHQITTLSLLKRWM